ncbi:hypothetical protein GUJ93_ZPchr0008g13596 [Zizania palustris]|uniref:Uncharacterized protein n=1 Tax=Zizania palustris TaxID=103762 RepID=A0A8J5RIR2_ZIZPA|nr:hypothetical protein GUJ93_ZPchr0008g13596 [Zizania palustris]
MNHQRRRTTSCQVEEEARYDGWWARVVDILGLGSWRGEGEVVRGGAAREEMEDVTPATTTVAPAPSSRSGARDSTA